MPEPVILNVDHAKPMLYEKTRVLRQAGFQVLEAGTADEALQIVRQHKISLVLSDITLPDANGIELCGRIKSDPQTATTLVLLTSPATGRSDVDRLRRTNRSADAYLTQPVEPEELISTVRSLLHVRTVEHALRRTESRFRALFDSDLIGLVLSDSNGKILEANDTFLRIVGFGREDVTAGRLNINALMPPSLTCKAPQSDGRCCGKSPPSEQEFLRRDGTRAPVLVGGVMLDETEECACFVLDLSQHKHAEQELQRANERFRLAADAVHTVIYDIDLETNIVSRTSGLKHVLGISPEEIGPSPKHWFALVHPDDRAILKATLQGALESGSNTFSMEYRARNSNGQYRSLWDRGIVVRDSEGKAHRIVGSRLDITERKQAEEALRHSELRYSTLAAAVPEILYTNRADGSCDYVSQRFCEITGVAPAAAEGWGWLDALHPDDRKRVVDNWLHCTKSGAPFQQELRFRKHDGSYRWFRARSMPMQDSSGRISKWFGVFMDIDQQKQSEAELTATKDELSRQLKDMTRLHKLITSLSTGLELQPIFEEVLRAVTELQHAPMGSLRLYDRTHNELHTVASIGVDAEFLKRRARSPLDAGPSSIAVSESRIVIAEDLKTELPEAAELEFMLRHRIQSICSTPIVGRGGSVLGAISSYWHERHRPTDRQIRMVQLYASHAGNVIETAQLYQQAQQANRLKDEFLATVSHELRTPLNAIFGWVHLLRGGKLNQAKADRALNIIERNARLQTQLIEDLLDVSRIVTGKLRLNLTPVELSAVIKAAVEGIRPAATAKDIRVHMTLDPAAGNIMGDAGRLQQIVWNLISNAVKFTPAGGSVGIALEPKGKDVAISVSDTGQGIGPEFLPYVFDRFRQADSTSTRSHGGLGLGLAIVRHLVELHGGTVAAQSDGMEKGSTFTATFPTCETAALAVQPRRPSADAISNSALEHVKVQIVDDSPDERETLSVLLTHYGAEVRVAASAQEALQQFADWLPDVLISDIEMPEENGYALIGKLRSLAPEQGGLTPAIALTAYTRVEDRMRALAAGFQIHVPKPVEPGELVTAVANIAGRLRHFSAGAAPRT